MCAGGFALRNGICSAAVLALLGYVVIWPSSLTSAVSAAMMRPRAPPSMQASSLLSGSVTRARPERNATYLHGGGACVS